MLIQGYCDPKHVKFLYKAFMSEKQVRLVREIFIDNLLVRVHWITEMIVVERPGAMGV